MSRTRGSLWDEGEREHAEGWQSISRRVRRRQEGASTARAAKENQPPKHRDFPFFVVVVVLRGVDALLFLSPSISVLLQIEGQLNEITRCSLAPRVGAEQSGVTQHG